MYSQVWIAKERKRQRERERGRRRVESELYHFVLSFSTGCGLPADLKQELRYYGRLHSHAPLNDMSDGKDKVHVSFFYPFNCKIFLNVQVHYDIRQNEFNRCFMCFSDFLLIVRHYDGGAGVS